MISKKITTQTSQTNRFEIEHKDIVYMLNEPNVFNYMVSPSQTFYLYMVTPTGKEIFLSDISMSESLSIGIVRQITEDPLEKNLEKADVIA